MARPMASASQHPMEKMGITPSFRLKTLASYETDWRMIEDFFNRIVLVPDEELNGREARKLLSEFYSKCKTSAVPNSVLQAAHNVRAAAQHIQQILRIQLWWRGILCNPHHRVGERWLRAGFARLAAEFGGIGVGS